jgi:hypothetical protein
MFQWERSSFGLREDKLYIYEEIWQLVKHCKVSFTEAWDMPVAIRKWWIRKTSEEAAKEKESSKPAGAPPPKMKK